jgi:hypothetical protein
VRTASRVACQSGAVAPSVRHLEAARAVITPSLLGAIAVRALLAHQDDVDRDDSVAIAGLVDEQRILQVTTVDLYVLHNCVRRIVLGNVDVFVGFASTSAASIGCTAASWRVAVRRACFASLMRFFTSYGAPGCGKTLLARRAALCAARDVGSASAVWHFAYVDAAQLTHATVGDSERQLVALGLVCVG